MEELDTRRLQGYLDLDEYFNKKLGREHLGKTDLVNSGLIEIFPCVLENKFWILDKETGDKIALFKEEPYRSEEAYAELLAEEVAKTLNIPSAHYDLVTFQGNPGVISYNFIKEGEDYNSGFDIIVDFYYDRLSNDKELVELYGLDYENDGLERVVNKLNNLEDIWSILEDKYKDHPQKAEIVKNIMNGLVDRLIFDILTINSDRHADNWMIIDDLEGGKKLSVAFDNARTLNMNSNIYQRPNDVESLKNQKLRFTVDKTDNRRPLEVLEQFLNISSSEYRDLVVERVDKLKENVEFIPSRVEERTKRKMPDYLKKYFIDNMNNHLYQVEEVINKSKKGAKK